MNQNKEKDCDTKIIYEKITQDSIDSLTKDSPIYLLNALYQCEDYILLDENKKAIINEKSFNYISSFYLSFLSNKDSISDEYLQARKDLYKSIQLLKQEQIEKQTQELQKEQKIIEQSLQNLDSKQKEIKLKSLQNQKEKQLKNKQKHTRLNKDSNLTLYSKDKSIAIIFLDKRGKAA